MTLRSGQQLKIKEKQDRESSFEKNEENKKDGDPSPLLKEYRPTILYLTKLKKDHMDK